MNADTDIEDRALSLEEALRLAGGVHGLSDALKGVGVQSSILETFSGAKLVFLYSTKGGAVPVFTLRGTGLQIQNVVIALASPNRAFENGVRSFTHAEIALPEHGGLRGPVRRDPDFVAQHFADSGFNEVFDD